MASARLLGQQLCTGVAGSALRRMVTQISPPGSGFRSIVLHPSTRVQRHISVARASAGAKNGDFVAVHYTGTLDDGSVFDSSREDNREPLGFVVAGGKVIKGFDKAVTGLSVGATRKVRISPEDAYGNIREDLILKFPPTSAPEGLKAGDNVQLSNGLTGRVTQLDAAGVAVDMNHELAGKHLTFDVELMQLVPSEKLQKATFGAGCFWGVELAFQRVPGVLFTEVGYSNGSVPSPTYEQVCSGNTGHAEVVQVAYDPDVVSFETLLDVFWERHDPTQLNRQGGDVGTQYRSGIYVHTPEQKAAAQASKDKAQSRFSNAVVTEIADVAGYYPAEQYHQQYLARGGRFGRPQAATKGCNDPIRCYG